MKARTLASMARSGELALMVSVSRLVRPCYRVAFLASGLSSGWLNAVASGAHSSEALAAQFGVDRSLRDGLDAWLRLGVALGELRVGPQGYSVRGRLSRKLVAPERDAAAALIEEAAALDIPFIERTPWRLQQRRPFTLAEQDARLVARASRVAGPFICEAMDEAIPLRSPVSLFEVGCGAAAYIKHAAMRNPALKALGLELQAEAARLATENVARWNLNSRVRIEVGDVMRRQTEPAFDIVTLHQNIYYFPVTQRVEVLRHVGSFLKPGGRFLVTTWCQGRGLASALMDLCGAMMDRGGRLPTPAELEAQIREAGFAKVIRRSLIPGESFWAFLAQKG